MRAGAGTLSRQKGDRMSTSHPTTIGTFDPATEPRRMMCAMYGCTQRATWRMRHPVPSVHGHVYYGYCDLDVRAVDDCVPWDAPVEGGPHDENP
jgi:hypothetical protein